MFAKGKAKERIDALTAVQEMIDKSQEPIKKLFQSLIQTTANHIHHFELPQTTGYTSAPVLQDPRPTSPPAGVTCRSVTSTTECICKSRKLEEGATTVFKHKGIWYRAIWNTYYEHTTHVAASPCIHCGEEILNSLL